MFWVLLAFLCQLHDAMLLGKHFFRWQQMRKRNVYMLEQVLTPVDWSAVPFNAFKALLGIYVAAEGLYIPLVFFTARVVMEILSRREAVKCRNEVLRAGGCVRDF